ncbi:MAG: TlpA family protein disulfide reductase [Candidatus Magasanikbacteria bacterium]|nr:TlpA family protein disulfide reductase [Candidatus Magasanikbacteria bacterium]
MPNFIKTTSVIGAALALLGAGCAVTPPAPTTAPSSPPPSKPAVIASPTTTPAPASTAAALPAAALPELTDENCARILQEIPEKSGNAAREQCEKMLNEKKPAKEIMESPATAAPPSYTGQRLAGVAAPLLELTEADYLRARGEKKLIVLYFYASWCPICQKEFPELQDAFNRLSTDQVIGFRVHYNDREVNALAQQLARQFGVAYQHTKVFLKNEQRILKAPDSWDQERYLFEITKALQ